MKHCIILWILCLISTSIFSQRELTYELNFDPSAGVKQYEKAEIGVSLPSIITEKVNEFIGDSNRGLNPYDADKIDLSSTWVSPSGISQKVNGFFYHGFRKKNDDRWEPTPTKYNWLLRWSPEEIGTWTVSISLQADGQEWFSNNFTIECLQGDSESGYLTVDPSNPNGNQLLYKTDSDKPFFALGHNIVHGGHGMITPKKAEIHRKGIKELGRADGNFWRLEFGMSNYLPSGYNATNYTEKLAPFCELDQVMDLSSSLNMYFIAFRHHVEVENGEVWSEAHWGLNGYRKSFNLSSREEYFTNPEVLRWQKNELRYIMARWGYAKSFSFFGFSEINYWIDELSKEKNMGSLEAMKLFNTWFNKQKTFVQKDLEMKRMLYANSFATASIPNDVRKIRSARRNQYDIFQSSDIVAYHNYGIGKENNLVSRPKLQKFHRQFWNKPSLMEEAGLTLPHLYCATDESFFTSIWTSSFYGDLGCAMHYWWDRGIHYNEMEKLYIPLKKFKDKIDYTKKFSSENGFDGTVKSTKLAYYSLIFQETNEAFGFLNDPSYYWRNMTAENPGVKQLVFEGQMKNPCIMEDGHRLGEPLSNENLRILDSRYEDAYTKSSETTPKTSENYGEETIKINGLERVGFFKRKRTYTVTYYDPRDPNLKVTKTEKVKAKKNGKLCLTMDSSNWPASAFHLQLIK